MRCNLNDSAVTMKTYFLWPEHVSQHIGYFVGDKISASDTEDTLHKIFPDAVPVLFSSARAGLSATLQLLQVGRPDIVWCPPYSSHCVLESISRFATPTTTDVAKAKVALIYHQWGFVHRHELASETTVIEDAVDTFFLPGTNPFAGRGRFALWSLPKVIGSTWGGVVFCRTHDDAEKLRAVRDERSGQLFQAMLRMASDHSMVAAKYWHGYESMNGGLPDFSLRQIKERLGHIPDIAKQRLRLLDIVRSAKIKVQLDEGRLPSNIPLKPMPQLDKWWGSTGIFSAGMRSMNLKRNFSKDAWGRVAPLPVHQDISESVFNLIPLDQFEGA